MKFATLASAALFSSVLAVPVEKRQFVPEPCAPLLTQQQANAIVAQYAAVIAQQNSNVGSPTATAQQLVSNSYSEQSDSANIQLGIPLGAITTPSKQAFITNSQADPPVVTETLNVLVAGCNNILWQWRSTHFGDNKYPVQGFHLFELTTPFSNQIQKTYFEFDSIAGALDIGFKVKQPNGKPLKPTVSPGDN